MILRVFLIYLCSGMLLTSNGSALATPQENPIKWSLAVKSRAYKAGDKFTARLTAQIAAGWHLYALEEVPNGPRPTRITLVAQQPFGLSGNIEAPKPITKFDENFGVETPYYEKAVTFKLSFKIKPEAKPGKTTMVVQTRYQVCNEQMCLPPKTVKVAAAIAIK